MIRFSTECKTSKRAKDPNKKCQFPFVYKNITHYRCTFAGYSKSRWCATENSTTYRADEKWGYCGLNCPQEQCKKNIYSRIIGFGISIFTVLYCQNKSNYDFFWDSNDLKSKRRYVLRVKKWFVYFVPALLQLI